MGVVLWLWWELCGAEDVFGFEGDKFAVLQVVYDPAGVFAFLEHAQVFGCVAGVVLVSSGFPLGELVFVAVLQLFFGWWCAEWVWKAHLVLVVFVCAVLER